MVGFIFGGNTGRSYEELQKQRETADAIAAQIMGRQLPTTSLGGIGALIGGIGAGVTRYGADKGMKEGKQGANSAFDNFLGKIMGGGSSAPSAPGAPSAAPSPQRTSGIPMSGAASEVAATSPRVASAGVSAYPDASELNSYLADDARRAKLPAGMRNNNPGNIKFVGQKVPGIVGPSVNTDQGDPQAVFDTPESGMRAMHSLLLKKYKGGKLTPNQIIAGNMGWTPGNFDAAANVAKYAGIGPDDDIGLTDPNRAAKFMRGLMMQEHGKSSSLYPDSMILSALGGGTPTQVASLDPSVGMPPAAAAIERQAPASGYVDPMVSAPNAQRPVMAGNANAPQAQQPVATPPQPQPMPQQQVAQNGQPPVPPQAPQPPQQQPQNSQFPSPPQPPSPPQAPTNPYQGVDPEMLKLLSNPFLDADKKAILQTVIQQQMQASQSARDEQQWRARQDYQTQLQRSDPAYQLDINTKQAQLDALRNPKDEFSYTTLPDGTVLRTNKRGGQPEKVFESAPKPTTNQLDYEYYATRESQAGRQPLGPLEWEQAQRKAGASSTTVSVGETDKFYENLDKKNAETFAAMSDGGIAARAKLGQIDRLEGLFANVPQGVEGGLKKIAGDWGVAIGEGTSDIQAASALLEKMVPEQRAPGSGPMSDADIKMFRSSLPRVLNQPGGNQLIFQTMRGIADYEMKMGEIADQVADRAIKPADGRRMIRELKNPLSEFKIPEGPTPNEGRKTTTGVQWSIGD